MSSFFSQNFTREHSNHYPIATQAVSGVKVIQRQLQRQRLFLSNCMLASSMAACIAVLFSPPHLTGAYGNLMLKICFLAFGSSLLFGFYFLLGSFRSSSRAREEYLLAAIRYEVDILDFDNGSTEEQRKFRQASADKAYVALQSNDAFFFQASSFLTAVLILGIFFLAR